MDSLKILKRFFGTSALGFILLTIGIVLINKNTNILKTDYALTNENTVEEQNITLSTEAILASYDVKNEETRREVVSRSAQSRESHNYISIEQVEISKDMDLTKRCNISKEDFIELMNNLKPDTSGFFAENASLIYDLCEKYSLNEIFFCGLISAESGWNIASNHRRTHNYISLMSSNGLIYFDSVESGLEQAASTLHNKYLTEGGAFYKGKTLEAVRTRFCPVNPGWTSLVYGRMQQIIK